MFGLAKLSPIMPAPCDCTCLGHLGQRDRDKRCLHWRRWHDNTTTMTRDNDTLVLALATLGEATEIGSFLFMSRRQRWQRQIQSCDCRVSLSLMVTLTTVANVNDPLRLSIVLLENIYRTNVAHDDRHFYSPGLSFRKS